MYVRYHSAKRGYSNQQEPSSYGVPGLRYEGKYKLHSIIGTARYMHVERLQQSRYTYIALLEGFD